MPMLRRLLGSSAFIGATMLMNVALADANASYHIVVDGSPSGPYSISELVSLFQEGRVTIDSLVWRPGENEWKPAHSFEELAASFTTVSGSTSPGMPTAEYYVDLDGPKGPFDAETLLRMVQESRLERDTLVWTEGMENWRPAGMVDDLDALFAADGGSSPPGLPPLPPSSESTETSQAPDMNTEPAPPVSPPPPGSGGMANADERRLNELAAKELQYLGVPATSQLHSGEFHGATPNEIPGGRVITTKELVQLKSSGEKVHIFHVLGSDEAVPGAIYAEPAYAPGDYNDDTQKFLEEYLNRLTEGSRSVPLAFYCQSRECWMSYNASLRAINAGYTNVLWYRGGIEAWQSMGFETAPPIR